MPDDFMTVAEVAEILKVNQQTVRNWIDRGELSALHVGRRVRIRRADFDELLGRRSTGRATAAGPSIWEGEIPAPVIP
jgi:putative molybdopterin biosynthesis protein